MAKILQFHPFLTLKHQFMRSRLTLPYVFMYMARPAKNARYCKLNQPFPMEQRQENHYLTLGHHNYNSSSAYLMRVI